MDEYVGFKEVVMTDEEWSDFYETNGVTLGKEFLQNEYLIIKNHYNECVGQFRWDGNVFVQVPYKIISNQFLGKVKPRNEQQQLAIDLLYNKEITIKTLTGKFGTGKDYLMLSAAIDLIGKGVYSKIVWVRNNIEVKDSKSIGHLPGSYEDKLLPFSMPMADHLGGVDNLKCELSCGRIETIHLGFIRGRCIKDSIIICSEAENLTKEHVQLLIGRVGEGSSLWINGDYRQVDAAVFRENNGLMTGIEKLKGHKRYGHVKLVKVERSETAAMADLLD